MFDLRKSNNKVEKVEFEGDFIFIRHLKMSEIDKLSKITNPAQISKQLLKSCLCDENGNSLNYSDEDIDNQSGSTVKAIAELIMKVNDLSEKKS